MSLSNEKDFLKRLTKRTLVKDFRGGRGEPSSADFPSYVMDNSTKVFLTPAGAVTVFDAPGSEMWEVTFRGITINFFPLSWGEIISELEEDDNYCEFSSYADAASKTYTYVIEDCLEFTMRMRDKFGHSFSLSPDYRSFIGTIFSVLWPELLNH